MQTPSRGGASFCCFSAGTFSGRCPCWWGSSGPCSMLYGGAEQSAGSSSPNSQSWLPCVCTKHLEGKPGWECDLEHSSSPSPPSSLHLALNESHPQEWPQLFSQMHFPSQSLLIFISGEVSVLWEGRGCPGATSWLVVASGDTFLSVWEGFGSIFPYVSYWDIPRSRVHEQNKTSSKRETGRGFPAEDLSVALPAVVWSEDTESHYLLMAHWSKILLHDLISHMVGVCPVLLSSGFG